MKKWIVVESVNGEISKIWEFENKEESLKFYNKKVNYFNKERIEENRKSRIKFKNDDIRRYTWLDIKERSQRLNASKTWYAVKEERWEYED